MPAWNDFEKRHGELVDLRRREEPTWRELARFLSPDDVNIGNSEPARRDGVDDPFDSTALYALDDFVGNLFTKANNPAERWFSLSLPPGFKDLEKFRPVAEYLKFFADQVFDSLDPARDNFYLSTPAWYANMGVCGTGFLWDEERTGTGAFNTRALSIGECFKDVDANGETFEFHRKYPLTKLQAERAFGNRAPQMRDGQRIEFVHVLVRNDQVVPGAPGKRGKRWHACIASPEKRDFYFEQPGGGYLEMPVHEIEWRRPAARPWARGPGHNALADMRGNDELTRAALVGAQFDAEPMILSRDEDIMTMADVSPSALLYGAINEQGKQNVAYLERKNSPQTTLNERQIVRAAIKTAFRFSLANALLNRPQMTAEEVMTLKSEDLKLAAPNLVRQQRGLGSFVSRRANLLARAGRIPPPPPEMKNVPIGVQFESPFAKAQQQELASGVLKWVNTKVSLQQATENPMWMDDVDVDGVSGVLHQAMTQVPSVRLDPRQVEQNRQRRAQAEQQQISLEQDQIDAETIATRAHAAQAGTRAAERRAGR